MPYFKRVNFEDTDGVSALVGACVGVLAAGAWDATAAGAVVGFAWVGVFAGVGVLAGAHAASDRKPHTIAVKTYRLMITSLPAGLWSPEPTLSLLDGGIKSRKVSFFGPTGINTYRGALGHCH